jgi:phosphoglycerate dehydrogenase-like enzyme
MKIVIGMPPLQPEFVRELGAEFPDLSFVRVAGPNETIREIADADAFIGRPSREEFLAATRLRWIHNLGMGIDQLLQVREIVESDVIVTNAPGPHANPMADHAIAMILAFSQNFRELLDDQRAKRWDGASYAGRVLELNGSVLGLLSIGGIGRAVAQRALAFGMQVYAVDPSPTDVPAGVRAVWGLERLDDLLALCDWFVVTSPLTPGTRGLIDARRLALLKPSAHLIVVSRGGIVDEAALADALASGRLSGAALDATAIEPLPADSPLWDLENLILSPHMSALVPSLAGARRQILRENLRRFTAGRPLAHVCDKSRGF